MGERLVVTTMRNEGPFILEWVAWQHMIGFDHVIVLYNDCTDHSPALLQILDQAGWITAVPYTPRPDKPVKWTALRMMTEMARVQQSEWVFNIDVDEFLVIHPGEGKLDDMFAAFDMDEVHGIAVYWKCFGDSGYFGWQDELTHRTFVRSARSGHKANAFFKVVTRRIADFERIGVHSPKGWRAKSAWGSGQNQIFKGNGQRLNSYHPIDNANQYTNSKWIGHEIAQLNHYITRTRESFELKMGKPSTAANRDRYTEQFFRNKNRNEEEDLSAQKYAKEFDRIYGELCALPGAMALHHQCCLDYIERLAEINEMSPEEDPRTEFHRLELAKYS